MNCNNDQISAWIVSEPGSNIQLQIVPIPRPAQNQIGVRIEATALNFADLLMIEGTYQDTPPFPLVPGLEVAGTVDRVGASVSDFAPGDRVAVYAGHGGLADYLVTDVARVRRIPDALPFDVAAAFQIAYGTSHLALAHRARLKPGETVAVLGAAGGVGLTAVELSKTLGARVIAIARGPERLAIASDAGADHLLDSDTDPAELLAALRRLGPLDVVYDATGGTMAETAFRALRPEGRHLLIGFASGDLPTLKPNHLLVKNIDVIGVNWGAYLTFAPDILGDSLDTLMGWIVQGRLTPHIGARFSFDQVPEALAALRDRRATGKIVLTR